MTLTGNGVAAGLDGETGEQDERADDHVARLAGGGRRRRRNQVARGTATWGP